MWAVTAMPITVMLVAVTVSVETLSFCLFLWHFISFFINPEEVDCQVFLMVTMEQVIVAALLWQVLTIWIIGILAVKKTKVIITLNFQMSNFIARVSMEAVLFILHLPCCVEQKIIDVTWSCFDDIINSTNLPLYVKTYQIKKSHKMISHSMLTLWMNQKKLQPYIASSI